MNCILSATQNWGIGKDNELLFRLSEDMAFFRKKTSGNVVIMGHNTLKSLPNSKPLPNRTNIVLSRSLEKAPDGVLLYHNMDDVLKHISASYPPETVFIIGGENIYRQFLPYCHTAFVTKIHKSVSADHFFPNLDKDANWSLISASEPFSSKDVTFTFCSYQNNNPLPLD